MSKLDDAATRAEVAAQRVQVEAITGATLVLESTDYTVEFRIDPPADFEYRGKGMVRATGIRARVSRSAQPKSDEDEPYISVRALIQPLTAKGEPSKREQPYWWYMPTELAPLLFGRAAVS